MNIFKMVENYLQLSEDDKESFKNLIMSDKLEIKDGNIFVENTITIVNNDDRTHCIYDYLKKYI